MSFKCHEAVTPILSVKQAVRVENFTPSLSTLYRGTRCLESQTMITETKYWDASSSLWHNIQRLRDLLLHLHMCKSRRAINLSIRNHMKFRYLNCRLRRIFWVWSSHGEASTGLDSNPELCVAGAVLSTKLSYQASCELVVIWGDEPWEKGLIFQHC